MLCWIPTSILVIKHKRILYLGHQCAKFLLRIILPNEYVRKHKLDIDVQNFIFWKLCCLWSNVKKYDTARKALALCLLVRYGYKHTLRIWFFYIFSVYEFSMQCYGHCSLLVLFYVCICKSRLRSTLTINFPRVIYKRTYFLKQYIIPSKRFNTTKNVQHSSE
jgi:hypothetical protein